MQTFAGNKMSGVCMPLKVHDGKALTISSAALTLANAYRVLLTRARQGMVIFVPKGNESDYTRPAKFYDETHAFLSSCGITRI